MQLFQATTQAWLPRKAAPAEVVNPAFQVNAKHLSPAVNAICRRTSARTRPLATGRTAPFIADVKGRRAYYVL